MDINTIQISKVLTAGHLRGRSTDLFIADVRLKPVPEIFRRLTVSGRKAEQINTPFQGYGLSDRQTDLM